MLTEAFNTAVQFTQDNPMLVAIGVGAAVFLWNQFLGRKHDSTVGKGIGLVQNVGGSALAVGLVDAVQGLVSGRDGPGIIQSLFERIFDPEVG